jgi:hypothetical protein
VQVSSRHFYFLHSRPLLPSPPPSLPPPASSPTKQQKNVRTADKARGLLLTFEEEWESTYAVFQRSVTTHEKHLQARQVTQLDALTGLLERAFAVGLGCTSWRTACLKGAWFQPLNLKCDRFAFKCDVSYVAAPPQYSHDLLALRWVQRTLFAADKQTEASVLGNEVGLYSC